MLSTTPPLRLAAASDALVTFLFDASAAFHSAAQSNNPFIKAWHTIDENAAERVVLLHKDPAQNAVPPTSADVTVIPSDSTKVGA